GSATWSSVTPTRDPVLGRCGAPPIRFACSLSQTIRYGMEQRTGRRHHMSALPDPVWPVLVLAVIQFGDGLLCLRPVAFVAACFEGVGFPRRWWWIMPPIKFAAAAGLIAGIWIPYLG